VAIRGRSGYFSKILKYLYYDMGHSRLDDKGRLFQIAVVTAEADKFRIVRFCYLHGFLVTVVS